MGTEGRAVEKAMSKKEVRENFGVRYASQDERCPGFGRWDDNERVTLHVPGRPDESLSVLRCNYCETMYELPEEGDAPALDRAIAELRAEAKEYRRVQTEEAKPHKKIDVGGEFLSGPVYLRKRDDAPFSPAAIDMMARASGLRNMLRVCKGSNI